MRKMKPAFKFLIIAGLVGGGIYGANRFQLTDYLKDRQTVAASVPTVEGGTFRSNSVAAVQHGGVPISNLKIVPNGDSYTAKVLTIPWNAMAGLSYANGGPTTAKGSLMDKGGVSLVIERQDEYSKMQADLVKFSEAVSKGENKPASGAAFAIIMGDGGPGFLAGAQEALNKVAKGQQLVTIGFLGYSRGEDKCVIDASAQARGALIKGVLGDGDINVCVQYAADNGIPINADSKTYDPNAMNFSGADSFADADKAFIAHAKETRLNVSTNKREDVEITGSATWTPGDVNLAKNRGHIKVLASTAQYMWQMPATIIGNKQWMSQHPAFVNNMLAAAFQGGELVRSNDQALLQASAINAKIFKEQDAAYWAKYFKGTVEDGIALGGSTTSGLGDNLFLFGMNGNDGLYRRIYNVFGKVAVKYFPDQLKEVVPYDTVVDTSFLQTLASQADSSQLAIAKPDYNSVGATTGTFAKKAVSIEFETGKSTLTGRGIKALNEVMDNLAVSGLVVEIRGHTDNVGNTESNQQLSKARADAVKKYIVSNASSTFPDNRLRTKGYGDSDPIADNKTSDGRAQNRRVEIVQLTTSN